MINFEYEVNKVAEVLDDVKRLCNIRFEYYVYPKYDIQGAKYIIKLNPYRKAERCIKHNTSKKDIFNMIINDLISFIKGIADNYECNKIK